jgi:tetratricopeptide (TPR) repeat protein
MQPSLHNPGYALRQSSELYAPSTLVRAMRSGILSIALAALVLQTLHAVAGTAEQSQLLQAQKLSNQGEIAQVIRILEPLVHSEPGALDDASRGSAWNLLGSAHEDLGEYDIARRCYEAAIHLLKTLPAAGSTYASTLANLGSLETSMGQLDAAETTLHKAKELYSKTGNHTGLAEIGTSLAILAIAHNDMQAARRFMADAFREADIVKNLDDSDRAEMYGAEGLLAARTHHFAAAISAHQESIDFWIRARGPKHYLVAIGYALQGDAYRELGDYSKAYTDFAAALALVEQTVGRNTPMYAATELLYARLLHATGANVEATRTEAEAKARLEAIHQQQCDTCSISAAGLR